MATDRGALWRFATSRRVVVGTAVALALTAPVAAARAQDTATKAGRDEGDKGAATKLAAGESDFLPIPIFITEPAIGAGFGAALGYFHPRKDEQAATSSLPAMTAGSTAHLDDGQKRPPDISGIAGAYTENGTWLVGVGHFASWRRDRIRYAGAVVYSNVNATFYLLGRPLDFELKGGFLYQDIKLRIGSSRYFVGGKLSYIDATSRFKLDLGPGFDVKLGDTRDAGLAAQLYYEGRDNIFTPNRGQLFEGLVWRYDTALGGDYEYWKVGLKFTSFHPFGDRFVLGWRVDLDAVAGDPPFWGFPWIIMRGVPAMRYQNERAAVTEVEGRWNIFDRWAVVGFAGIGAVAGDDPLFETKSDILAGGVGARYLFKPEMGLWVGVDLAHGPETSALYIQVGHAW
jgi:hypothetical protein